MDIKLSILVATSGRPTLLKTVHSILEAGFGELDEVVVVTDGPADLAGMLVGIPLGQLKVLEHPHTDDGHRAGVLRNAGMPAATGDYLLFIDDDDVYTQGALSRIRYHIGKNPGRPLMFRMTASWGETLWRTKGKWRRNPVSHRNIGTPMFVTPNTPGRLGEWGHERSSDWGFIRSTLQKWPEGSIVLVDDTICVCSPGGEVGW